MAGLRAERPDQPRPRSRRRKPFAARRRIRATSPSSGSTRWKTSCAASCAGAKIEIGDMSTAGGRVSFLVRDPAKVDAVREIARNQTQPVALTGQRTFNVAVVDGSRVVLTPTQAGIAEALDNAMKTAREVVYNRVDPEGTKEVTVIRQGKDRILVQVPGPQGSGGAEGAARQDRPARVQAGRPHRQPASRSPRAGPRSEARCCRWPGGGRIAVLRRAMVNGDQLVDAQQTFDENNQPVGQHPLRRPRLQGLRPGHPAERQQAVRHRPRRRRPVRAQHQRADPRRAGQDLGQLHRPDRDRSRRPAALGQASGRAEGDRGAHRRAGSRQGFDPRRPSSPESSGRSGSCSSCS